MGEPNTYGKGLKGILFFGGLQIFKLLLSIVRTKCTAIFLGPVGYGIYGLLTSTLSLIEAATGFGLGSSAVKDIAQAAATDEKQAISTTYTVLNRLVWWTGLLGTLLCAVFSKQLSLLTFGNTDYTVAFIIVSVTLLFNQLISGQGALLTGLRKYKYIAQANIYGSVLGFLVTVPLYAIWKIDAIVPVIVASALVSLLVSVWVVRKIRPERAAISARETLRKGRAMFCVGISLSLSYMMTMLAGYLIRIYVSHVGDALQVGLFIASFSLVNTYVGLIFSSIERDFYPRLSSVAADRKMFHTSISQEMELLLLLVAPLVMVFMVFSQPALAVFYSTKFLAAKNIICWTALAMLFKVPGWTLSIGLIARGDTKPYLRNQIAYMAYQLLLNIAGFHWGGLTGLGVSFFVSHFVYSLQMCYCAKRRFGYAMESKTLRLAAAMAVVALGTCILASVSSGWMLYGTGIIPVAGIALASYRELDKRIGITQRLRARLTK